MNNCPSYQDPGDLVEKGCDIKNWCTCLHCDMFKKYIEKIMKEKEQKVSCGIVHDVKYHIGNSPDGKDDMTFINLHSTTPPDKINEFDTGATRSSDENKTLWDLIPVECLERLAIKYTDGAKIYGKNNWKKGIPTERYIGGALRHFMQWRLGQRDEDHLAACVFNLFGIMFNEFTEKEYPYKKEK